MGLSMQGPDSSILIPPLLPARVLPDGSLPVFLFRSTEGKSCLFKIRFSWGCLHIKGSMVIFTRKRLCPGVGQTCPCSPRFTMWCWVTAISHLASACVLLVLCLYRMGSCKACCNRGVFAYTTAKNEHRAFLVHWYLFMHCHVWARFILALRLCGRPGLNWLFWSVIQFLLMYWYYLSLGL